jgi:hypothetical protein
MEPSITTTMFENSFEITQVMRRLAKKCEFCSLAFFIVTNKEAGQRDMDLYRVHLYKQHQEDALW